MVTTFNWTLFILVALLIGLGRYCSEGLASPFLRRDDLKQYIKNPEEILEYDVFEARVDHRARYRRSTSHKYPSRVTFKAFDEDYHLDLVPAEQFFSPDLKVEYLNEDGSINEKPLEVADCFYHGYAISHNASGVALSLCNGTMRGLISTKSDNIFITPLTKEHSDDYARRHKRNPDGMHLIYKRNVDDVPFCSNKTYVPDEEEDDTPPTRVARVNSANLDDSYIPPKYLEICLMLDIDFQDNYGSNHIEVAMAIMNVVGRRFTEPSAEVIMRIYIVRLIILPNDNPTIENNDFNIDRNLGTNFDTLNSVRRWGQIVNPPIGGIDGIPQRWDNIHILSGKDLIDASDPDPNTRSNLLGLAFSAGTCTSGLGVAIVEDIGIASGLVSAHEIGHTLTLGHDQDLGCLGGFIMSGTLDSGGDAFRWSTCSQRELKQFLRWQRPDSPSACMDNVPTGVNVIALPTLVLPGRNYTFDQQCTQNGGTESCSTTSCASLVCNVDGICTSQNFPAAEGTSCGSENEICLGGNCESPSSVEAPVAGGWSAWLDSICSRTCGGGVIIRQRVCNNPFPSWGGAPCVGEGVEFRLCNLQPCFNSADDFRNEQCEATASEPYEGEIFNWTQFFFVGENGFTEDLYCRNPCAQVGGNMFADRPPGYNEDGTECWDFNPSGASDLYRCVGGICEIFGCDGVYQSNVRYDVCRVCDGDGSTCSLVNGSATAGIVGAFNEIHIIPMGATSIVITNNDYRYTSHVAIMGTTSGSTFFRGSGFQPDPDSRSYNGDFLITHEFSLDQTTETFRSNGPTPEPLRLEVFWSRPFSNAVEYRYYVPDTFSWSIGSYADCSATCEGDQTRSVVCRSTSSQQVSPDSICITNVGPKPVTRRSCNTNPCPFWVPGIFGQCNVVCGSGNRNRSVICQVNGDIFNDIQCDPATRPDTQMPCNVGSCEWVTGNYGTCLLPCPGTQTRSVTCTNLNNNQVVPENNCDSLSKPPESRECTDLEGCDPIWVTGPYGGCNVVCGGGIQTRSVICQVNSVTVNDEQCDPATRPETQMSCNALSCEWMTGNYGTCSVTCGTGTQIRSVTCNNLNNNLVVPETNCDPLLRPPGIRNCPDLEDCPIAIWVTGPYGGCNVVCGGGIQTRTVICQINSVTVNDEQCDPAIRPETQMSCNVLSCEWMTGNYGTCSVTCGTGTQIRSVTCNNLNNNLVVPETNCDPLLRPPGIRNCSDLEDCPIAIWVTGPYGGCNVVCGGGIQTRSVICQVNSVTVNDEQCDPAAGPETLMPCNVLSCEWMTGNYGTCSVTCGTGTQLRSVTCNNLNNNLVVPETNCDPLLKPRDTRECPDLEDCDPGGAMWVTGPYGGCNATCGAGIQTREVNCRFSSGTVDDSQCDPTHKPANQRPCNAGSCRWFVGPRTTCSVTCGFGTRTRTVYCVNDIAVTVPDTNCDSRTRPSTTETCREISCSDQPMWVSSAFGECSTRFGAGKKLRTVTCQLGSLVVDDTLCNTMQKPREEQKCISLRCFRDRNCKIDDVFGNPFLEGIKSDSITL